MKESHAFLLSAGGGLLLAMVIIMAQGLSVQSGTSLVRPTGSSGQEQAARVPTSEELAPAQRPGKPSTSGSGGRQTVTSTQEPVIYLIWILSPLGVASVVGLLFYQISKSRVDRT